MCAVLETLTEYSGYEPNVQVSSELVVLLAIHVLPWNRGHMIEVGCSSLNTVSPTRKMMCLYLDILGRELLETTNKCIAHRSVLAAPRRIVAY